ncbi:MAG TPA: glutaredoxin family protein [Candidatus Eisenbacteria bacterium]|nr:glutaredoxin family protein [Candidatus Eisenbacteria bacterium]
MSRDRAVTELVLYTREGCALCAAMKAVVLGVAERYPLQLREIDVDASAELQQQYGAEVPVLFINGRKAFKYRVTPPELAKRLRRERTLR